MFNEKDEQFIRTALYFWDKLSPSEKELLKNGIELAKYKAGQTIHSPESDCIGAFLVKEGEIRVYMLSEDGREITLYRLGKAKCACFRLHAYLKASLLTST